MELIIVRHGETEWSLSGQHTGTTDIPLTADGRRQAGSLRPLLARVLAGREALVFSSPRKRATQTRELAMPGAWAAVEPLLAEYDYGRYEGLTSQQITATRPGWEIWRDGCPAGESTEDVGVRADRFLREHAETSAMPVVVFSHAHFSRILASRALGLAPENGRLFTSSTASVAIVQDYHGERCIGLWNATTDLLTGPPAPGSPTPAATGSGGR